MTPDPWLLESRLDDLERRIKALEQPRFRKPFATSPYDPQCCDCDRFGVVHVKTAECPIWNEPASKDEKARV